MAPLLPSHITADLTSQHLTLFFYPLADHLADPCLGLECDFGAQCMVHVLAPESEPFCSCDNACAGEDEDSYEVVCGSDHVSYRNACDIKQAACVRQENITILARSSCGTYD